MLNKVPNFRRCSRWLLVTAISINLTACDGTSETGNETASRLEQASSRTLADIRKSGRLIVATRNAPSVWYIDRHDEPAGPEHALIQSFADYLGVKIDYQVEATVTGVLAAIDQGKADLAAAGLTITPERQKHYRFSKPYMDVTQQIVCRRDRVQPEEISDLSGLDIRVIANSSYSATLQHLQKNKYPELTWSKTDTATTEQLLHQVWQGEFDCTVADSNIVDINRRYYPELIAPLNLRRAEQLGWLMPKSARKLVGAVNRWLKEFEAADELSAWQDRYYGFFEVFDFVDIRAYIRRIDERFPQYRDYFREAAEQYDLPFTLLAAQGYQESHWNARAKSPTGVRGIMMLTRNTAEAMGVENRLDPRQSIFGGAKYLARMKQRFVDDVTEPDRTWLALAAYNVGRAHLHDAQTLARKQNKNPYLWRDVRQVLPLLADKRYYPDLKYGYARGTEPVRYVRRIREYQHVLNGEKP